MGLCIHSSDVNGLAIRVSRNQAGIDNDMADEEFGGDADDDEADGCISNSYAIGQVSDEDACLQIRCGYTACSPSIQQPPASQPLPAAFVGEIRYRREG